MFPIRDHNPSGSVPYVTYLILAINWGVFFAYMGLIPDQLEEFFYDYGMTPVGILAGWRPWTLITHMFLHAGWMHIIGNMLFLYIFGDNLEDELGHVRFAIFYLAAGILAAVLQIAMDPGSIYPMVGASGAIAGVLGGYLVLFPKARVDVLVIFVIFFRVFSIPAWIVLGIWFGLQMLNGFSNVADGVAYFAHIGGFVAGVVLVIPALLRRGGLRFWQANHGRPPHPEAKYPVAPSRIPKVPKR